MLDLQPIKDRLAAATPGPWRASPNVQPKNATAVAEVGHIFILATESLCRVATVDADLIANAPTDLAALVAENERVWLAYLCLNEAVRKHREEHLGACCTEGDQQLWGVAQEALDRLRRQGGDTDA